ncbi:head-specific guanylate cyclase [Toxorhynchites rutilus septentrionalis]|uniref:head-specific guanylate cyclase n=1 Tax=Toxorhynchites rutilus septentrionalis TaxID=329112 RepID=UPI00247A7B07|nr:head-specific guanylate cyclase [Toxorhynchites rutilus septentrionalis]XP_055616562.1 head-specific guanylate cyclase [Toxorhynchites rutilus septentrionalis]XP_055616563.1 head-specific guanylate cyclase [Toxorhynchites rutilus septentrionalis]
MACPFARPAEGFPRQPSTDGHGWNLDEDLGEIPDDALTLTHLNAAIQLLTAPSNEDVYDALMSLIEKYSHRWPGLGKLKSDCNSLSIYPHYDYLADVQDSLNQIDETASCDILVLLGEELIHTSCVGLIERAFKCLGSNLQEFLGSLDGVYDVLKLQEEDISDTGFVCASEGELIFTSERPVLAWLLLGCLQALSRLLFHYSPQIDMEPIDGDVPRYRYLFKLDDLREQPSPVVAIESNKLVGVQRESVSAETKDLKMDNDFFCKAFPWHFIMDEHLNLVQVGQGFSRLFKNYMATSGLSACTYFRFKRPRGLSLKFREIVRRTNTPFMISLRAPPGRPDFFAKGLEIKGQMVFCPESNSLLFMGSPFLDGLEGLTCNGLFISDIPLHDATREVILVGEQARAQDGLRRRMDKLKSSIEEANSAVTKERKKNVNLLQLMFPAEIAERLWLGAQIDAKTYPDVTMLFSDIVGFTSICSTASPFMVVNMLESLYKHFDELCGFFDVYKVETIGDAYCVASGLHRASIYDAHKVAWMALRMIETCSLYNTHDGQHIRMRVGIHTGTVLAGVVGRKMPRYCLFGHNVTIANKFESGSEACKVNISPTTREWLIKHPGYEFQLNPRDPSFMPKEFTDSKGKTCYFLEGYKHPTLSEEATLQEHIEAAMQQTNEDTNESVFVEVSQAN